MQLAKYYIDIGVRTNQLEPMLAFWRDEIGLPYEELLKVGNGVHQHRLALSGSVFKLNHAREPLPDRAPSSYQELLIARDVSEPETLQDPDGNAVTLVPRGYLDITHIGMRMRVRSLAAATRFFSETLQTVRLDAARYRWASTVFLMEEDPEHEPVTDMQGKGYRYTTVQVYKVDTAHATLVERGATDAVSPFTLGSTARISFVADPDGNWIEISQRASLTGDLSPG